MVFQLDEDQRVLACDPWMSTLRPLVVCKDGSVRTRAMKVE